MASMGKSRKTYFSTCGRGCRSKTGGGVTVYPTTKLSKYEGGAVRITYDRHTDTLSLVLKEGAAVAESDEGRPGVILDYDAAGDLVSLEILDASRRVTEAGRVEYQTTG